MASKTQLKQLKSKYKPHDGSLKYEIGNDSFQISYMHYDENLYESQLDEKITLVKSLFNDYPLTKCFSLDSMHVVKSPSSHYRNRCRFGISQQQQQQQYEMPSSSSSVRKLNYLMWEEGVPNVRVDSFPIAVLPIYLLMRPLIQYVERIDVLAVELKSVYFLSTLDGQVIVTFCYQKPLGIEWQEASASMRTFLENLKLASIATLNFVGRSKGIKITIGEDTILETLNLSDGRQLRYYQVDDGFSNPNAIVNTCVLDWVCKCVDECNVAYKTTKRSSGINILEMFCGNGNHTVAIAGFANRIVAVELNKSLCVAANRNLQLNGVHNAYVITCDSQKFAYRVLKKRAYTIPIRTNPPKIEEDVSPFAADNSNSRSDSTLLKDLPELAQTQEVVFIETDTGVAVEAEEGYGTVAHAVTETVVFDMVLVDPPRCGLDEQTRAMIKLYDYIVYISCNPVALRDDLESLKDTHNIKSIGLFDQFAYTPHIECGIMLERNHA